MHYRSDSDINGLERDMVESQHSIAQKIDFSLFIPSFRSGGTEHSVIRLANWLATKDYVVHLVVLNANGPLFKKVGGNVQVINLEVSRAAYSFFSLIHYLVQNQPSVLVSNMVHLNLISVLACRFIRKKPRLCLLERCDISVHPLSDRKWKHVLLVLLMRWLYEKADVLGAVSEGAASSLAETIGKAPDSIIVLPNSVDVQSIERASRSKVEHVWLSKANPIPVIVSVGRLVPIKGFDDLINAFSLLVKEVRARLLILGEGPDRARLEKMCKDLGLENAVEFPGYVENPFPIVRMADVFVLSSHSEGHPNALLEALALGVPTVATDCPSGPREILLDGEIGFLTPVKDVEAMADAMRKSLENRGLRRVLREKGKQRARDFNIDRIGQTFLAQLDGDA